MKKSSVVIYKNFPALVGERDGDKFVVNWCVSRATASGKKAVYASQKVREKDVLLLCESEASSIDVLLDFAESVLAENSEVKAQISETHELLLSDEETATAEQSFKDVAELLRGELKANESWGVYSALKASFEFEERVRDGAIYFVPRSEEKIAELKNRAYEKEHADELRSAFIERLKAKNLLPEDSKYMGDVEALALGTTDKSKTMKDAGFKEIPEKAHKLLLDTKIWDITRNPYPVRLGLSAKSATVSLGVPPEEERVRVAGVSYAIDSEWSTDPDDAIAFDGEFLWVHIADPASFVAPDSEIDKVARGRGATLYLPEGAARMLSEDCLEDYALGLREESKALSFKIKLGENGEIEDCDVLRTIVNVKRLTYEKADELKETPELKDVYDCYSGAITQGSSRISFFSADTKALDSYKNSFSVVDEFHSYDNDKVITAFRYGSRARLNGTVCIITSAGNNTNSPCYNEVLKARAVLDGKISDDSYFTVLYEYDEKDDWRDSSLLQKSNPALNTFLRPEILESDLQDALLTPSHQQDYKAKTCGIWNTQGLSNWLDPAEALINEQADFETAFLALPCYAAFDLSQTQDLTVYTLCFEVDEDGDRKSVV